MTKQVASVPQRSQDRCPLLLAFAAVIDAIFRRDLSLAFTIFPAAQAAGTFLRDHSMKMWLDRRDYSGVLLALLHGLLGNGHHTGDQRGCRAQGADHLHTGRGHASAADWQRDVGHDFREVSLPSRRL